MFTVSEIAESKLKERLQKETTDPEKAIRICSFPPHPNNLQLILDKERKGDKVIKTSDGKKVALIDPVLAMKLDGLILDYRKSPKPEGFIITERKEFL